MPKGRLEYRVSSGAAFGQMACLRGAGQGIKPYAPGLVIKHAFFGRQFWETLGLESEASVQGVASAHDLRLCAGPCDQLCGWS